MSLRLRRSEIEDFLAQGNKLSQEIIHISEQRTKGIRDLIETKELQGQAFEAAKHVLNEVFLPLNRGFILLSEQLQEANQKVAKYLNELIRNDEIREDILEEVLSQLRRRQNDLMAILFDDRPGRWSPKDSSILDVNARSIETLEEELHLLRSFDHQIRDVYAEAESTLQTIQRGLKQTSLDSVWDSKGGKFTTAG